MRIDHERQLHVHNSFVTLTYDPDSEPPRGSLQYSDFQLFMKRLRKYARVPVRFFVAGEYGELLQRPHYHVCLFGFDFPDKVFYKNTKSGHILYRSPALERLWPMGFSTIGSLTSDSASYTAKYLFKKITGRDSFDHYSRLDESTGEYYQLTPEFCRMSLKPGIGAGWLDKFFTDVYPSGQVVSKSRLYKSPRFYDKLLDRVDPLTLEQIQLDRADFFADRLDDQTTDRLGVREQVAQSRLSKFSRSSI